MIDQRQYMSELSNLRNRPLHEQLAFRQRNAITGAEFLYEQIEAILEMWRYNNMQGKLLAGELGNLHPVQLAAMQIVLNQFVAWDNAPLDDPDLSAWMAANGVDHTLLPLILQYMGEHKSPHAIIMKRDWSDIPVDAIQQALGLVEPPAEEPPAEEPPAEEPPVE